MGKVEAKIKIRNGILAKQIEQVQEKWLVVQFWRKASVDQVKEDGH